MVTQPGAEISWKKSPEKKSKKIRKNLFENSGEYMCGITNLLQTLVGECEECLR